jgi:hypothetical protein
MHDTKPVPFASSTETGEESSTCGGRLKLKASLQTVRAVGPESTFAAIIRFVQWIRVIGGMFRGMCTMDDEFPKKAKPHPDSVALIAVQNRRYPL